jgi:hypothetical protein
MSPSNIIEFDLSRSSSTISTFVGAWRSFSSSRFPFDFDAA